jgi:Tfp pilus assembly protein FimT
MHERGFSLVDVLITCLLVGTIVTVGLNSWGNFSAYHRLQTACETLMSDLWRARVASLAGNLPVSIEVREDRSAYSVVESGETPAWRLLPSGVKVIECPKTSMTFYPRGSVVPAGTYTLSNTSGAVQVIVAASGRFRWQRIQPK